MLVIWMAGVLAGSVDAVHAVSQDLAVFPTEPDVAVGVQPADMGRKVIDADRAVLAVGSRLTLPVGNADWLDDAGRVLEVAVSRLAVPLPGDEAKQRNEEEDECGNCADQNANRHLAAQTFHNLVAELAAVGGEVDLHLFRVFTNVNLGNMKVCLLKDLH